MKVGYGVAILFLLSISAEGSKAQRVSIVDRLRASLDKGIRHGLQRQKNEPTLPTASSTANVFLAGSAQPKRREEYDGVQQLSITPEDTDGTSDVVRQLTESYEDEVEEEVTEMELPTSKEGNLDDSTSERKRPLIKPTKYHYYPHNQHLYLLPECATQQVCNAVYTRFNFTQPLCACADRFQGPCSASIARNDQHTLEVGLKKDAKAKGGRGFKSPTLVKTCEETKLIRDCRAPQDWALLALQNVRTGKSQYLVICRCERGDLEGPMSHDQPAYAKVPGIRVYGMMCNSGNVTINRNGGNRSKRSIGESLPEFPWEKALEFSTTLTWE